MSNKDNQAEMSEEQVSGQNQNLDHDEALIEEGEVPSMESLQEDLEALRVTNNELNDQYVRAMAEVENTRRISAKEVEKARKFALEGFANELLPVRDSLEMGLAAFDVEGAETATLKEGVELTLQMLSTAMDKAAIKEVNPQDERFDPDFHQAMSMQERDDVAPNTVVNVVQKGYTLNGRLIRPAMVIVSKAPAAN